MSVQLLHPSRTNDLIWQAKVHLAAALRLAVLDGLEEGIDNHFTMIVPGRTDQYLLLPYGLHWSEARASDIIVFNDAGETDDHYQGLAKTMAEGERLAGLLQNKQVMFLKNHGVITVGDTVAQAYRRLYKLEKACQTQVLAMSSGQPLEVMSESVIAEVLQRAPEDRMSRSWPG
ncbi:MAG: hypothetical protein EBV64_12315 [Oxalobacteraceae bacterium]|nr:hypothetical protein [Oxalobacteraceae bacterium]